MKKKYRKTYIYLSIFFLVFLIIFQIRSSKNLIVKLNLLQRNIENIQEENTGLRNKYLKISKNEKAEEVHKNQADLKENTPVILEKLKKYNLRLLDFSTTESELNLNINGGFNSILFLINYLEEEFNRVEIKEIKFKQNGDQLFSFIKLSQIKLR